MSLNALTTSNGNETEEDSEDAQENKFLEPILSQLQKLDFKSEPIHCDIVEDYLTFAVHSECEMDLERFMYQDQDATFQPNIIERFKNLKAWLKSILAYILSSYGLLRVR